MTPGQVDALAWGKMDGLLPAIVQDAATRQLLMLGYMNRAALDATLASGAVTFWSRSKGRLWRKGETSGNVLKLVSVTADCDGDALLVLADPAGPACHRGTASCFGDEQAPGIGWLPQLSRIVAERAAVNPAESYTARLLAEGPLRVAQKVGEEGVELALAGAAGSRDDCIGEAADLLFHLTVLMQARGFGWEEVAAVLRERHGGRASSDPNRPRSP